MIAHDYDQNAHSDETLTTREFIRHPSDIPIEYCLTDKPLCHMDSIHNVSQGGLCFHTQQAVSHKQWLHLHIPISSEHFEVDAQVKWCEPANNREGFDVGVQFASKDQAFCARMVEQVCHIEQYKQRALKKEGRVLTGDQAAAEWIDRFAHQFPRDNDTDNSQ